MHLYVLLALMATVSFGYSLYKTSVPTDKVLAVQIDTGELRASSKALEMLANMSLQCNIETKLIALNSDDMLTNNEVLELGDLCIEQAEEAIRNGGNPFTLGIQKEQYKYEQNSGIKM